MVPAGWAGKLGEFQPMKRFLLTAAALGGFAFASGAAQAGYVYVGSWEVDSGPSWTTVPPAYSGVSAAALLFGGIATEYVTSTVDSNPADINFSAWISTWGGAATCGGIPPCGTVVADTYIVSTGGLYETPGDTSAYVNDWAFGSQYTNYAFINTAVPEPLGIAVLGVGLLGLGAARRTKTI